MQVMRHIVSKQTSAREQSKKWQECDKRGQHGLGVKWWGSGCPMPSKANKVS